MKAEELRGRARELEERERKESKKLADEEALRRLRAAEESIDGLQRRLAATKQVVNMLMRPSLISGSEGLAGGWGGMARNGMEWNGGGHLDMAAIMPWQPSCVVRHLDMASTLYWRPS